MTTTITRTPRSRLTLRTNLTRNPKVGSNATDWTCTSASGTVTGVRVLSGVPTGFLDTWYRVTLATAASVYIDARNAGAGVNLVTAGTTYTASAYLRPTSATASTGQVYIQWVDAGGAILSTTASADAPALSTAGFTRISLTAVAPAGAARGVLIFRANSSGTFAVGDRLDVTGILLEAANAPTSYFDGDTPAVGTTNYAWTSGQNSSTSIEVTDNPADVFTPELMTSLSASRAGQNTIISIPGSAIPSVVLHPTTGRRGKMTFLLGVESDAIAFDNLMKQQAAFVLVDTDRAIAGMTFNLDDAGYSYELDMETQEMFTGEISFVEGAS